MNINILDKHLADMIAAGEVVERPASAIKELVENSVDANAKNIVVEIKNGGMTYMRVTDDGDGIHPDDTVTAFKRHATSKISKKEDLDKICTLGFRGEALASIAAVSRVEMFTKTGEFPYGKTVVAEGGEILENEEAGCPDGTTIIVRNLFFNTPARMKFLKSDAAETTAVTDVVNKMILCHPDISIKLISNGKTVVSSHGTGSLTDSVHVVFGRDYAKNMIDVKYKEEYISVSGCTGAFSLSRKDRRHQIFFLNGRNIVNKTISAAVAEAYRNSVMVGRFPVCVLNIDIAPGLVDVNVHPTKMEVRFSDERKIYRAVYWAVKEALSSTRHVPEMDEGKIFSLTKEEKEELKKEIPPQGELFADQNEIARKSADVKTELKENIGDAIITNAKRNTFGFAQQSTAFSFGQQKGYADYVKGVKPQGNDTFDNEQKSKETSAAASDELACGGHKENNATENEAAVIAAAENATAESAAAENAAVPENKNNASAQTEKPVYLPGRDFNLVGQVFNTYIIAESGEDMLVIDQHAAHERIWFEELMEQWSSGSISPQSLMLPVVVHLDGHDFETASGNIGFFAEAGFEIDIFGAGDIIVRKVPTEIDDTVISETIAEIIDILSKNSEKPKYELYEKTLHTVACKKAIKGGKHLAWSDMEHLVSTVMALEGINTCPHGRPICVRISKTALEKQFKRIV